MRWESNLSLQLSLRNTDLCNPDSGFLGQLWANTAHYFSLTISLQHRTIIILEGTVCILALSVDLQYVTYIYHGVSAEWSGLADNPDHLTSQMTEEHFSLCLFHEMHASNLLLAFQ